MIKVLKNNLYRFLRWSEKYTKTDMVYLAKGGFWLTFGELFSGISVLVLAVAFANLLPKETYGIYKYILSLAGILSFFTLTGLSTSLVQSVARGYEKVFTDIIKIKIKFGLIGSFISLLISLYYYLNSNIILATAFLIVAVFIPFFDSFNIYTALLNGRKRFDIFTKYKIFSQIFVSTLIILVLFFTNSIFIILSSYFLLWLSVRIFFYFRTLKKEPPNNNLDNEVISYGKHLSLMGGFKLISNNLDKILLWHFVGPIKLAVYFFALAPVIALTGPILSLDYLTLPKLSSGNFEDTRKTFFRKIFILFLILIPITFLYILLSPYMYEMIFPQYLDSIIYSQIFALSILLIPGVFVRQILVAYKKKKELYITQILIPLIKIFLLIVLLPTYGIWGAIYTILIVQTVELFLNLLLIYKAS